MATSERLTKQERREAARDEARKLREEQARREKRNRIILIVSLVVGLVAVVALVWGIVSANNSSTVEGVARPEGSDLQGGIPVGASLEAGTTNDDVGAGTVNVYLDYTCSYCGQFEEINAADLKTMAQDGTATVIIHPVAILDGSGDYTDFSGQAANAAATVAEYAPAQFLDFNAALFTLWGDAVDAAVEAGATAVDEPTVADIAATAVSVGVAQDVADRFADREFGDWVAATTRQFGRDGFEGTPTILVDGEEFLGWPEPGALLSEVQGSAD
jgi:protein-disulfide isomerase